MEFITELFTNQWPLITAVCIVVASTVVFGKNLADAILKWREVLSASKSTGERSVSPTSFSENSTLEHVIKDNAFLAVSISENEGNLQRFRLKMSGQELVFRQILDLWESDQEFADFYSTIFKKCGFASYIWETPPLSTNSLEQPFEFVILNTPRSSSQPDIETFREYFDDNGENYGVVSFLNLGHDAMLVVPSPLRSGANYCGLAEFFEEAPLDQQRALWKVTAHQIKLRLSELNTWISVSGGGIPWLHIRLDSSPKYYRYMPYTKLDA